jgi:hypothetical protein
MAGDTLTTIEGMLKYIYLGPMRQHFNTKKVILAKLQKAPKEDVEGFAAQIPLVTGRAHGYGARPEGGTLPTAGNATYKQMSPPLRRNYGVIELTGPSIKAAKTNRGSFMRTLNASAVACEEGLLRSVNRQFWGDASGVLTNTAANAATTTTIAVADARFCEIGQRVDLRVRSNGNLAHAQGDSVTISAVDVDANTITISGSGVKTLTTDGVYLEDSRNVEMMGLRGIVYDGNPTDINGTGVGNLQALNASTETYWKSSRLHASGVLRDLSIDLCSDMLVDIETKSGKADEIDCMVARPNVWHKYGLLLTPDRRYGGQQSDLDGGFRYLMFDGIKFFFDRDCTKNAIYFLNSSSLAIYENEPLSWADEDGNILRWVQNKDAWTGFLVWYAELGVRLRFCNGILEDISA